MRSIEQVARHAHWLVAAFALALVCVPRHESAADDKSDLIRRIEDKLKDAADALERLPDDSNDGEIDRARSLVAEASWSVTAATEDGDGYLDDIAAEFSKDHSDGQPWAKCWQSDGPTRGGGFRVKGFLYPRCD